MVRLSNVTYWFSTAQLSKVGICYGKVQLGFVDQGCGAVMLRNVKVRYC